MENLKEIEIRGQRVLTSKQLAQCYLAEEQHIKQNFANNRKRFTEGKHYISLQNQELREFKNKVENFDLVGKTAKILYLWTEKGALLHAKSLNTDKAWEVYDYLVDFYFRAKKEQMKIKSSNQDNMQTVVDVPENPKMLDAIQKIRDDLKCMDVLLENCIRFTDEDTYNERINAAAGVVSIIMRDWDKLSTLKPNLIQKQY